ncbi:MAG: C-GCAxxG-C-C family protein [Bacillota bacterium]
MADGRRRLERADYRDRSVAPGSEEKLLDAVAKSAYDNDRAYEGCCRCVVAALNEHLHLLDDRGIASVIKASTALSAGVARKGEVCGALLGGIMALNLVIGSETVQDVDGYARGMSWAARLYDRFESHFGSVRCFEIQEGRLGRTYDFWDSEEVEIWYRDGGLHECPMVCGEAARMAAEMILSARQGQEGEEQQI